MAARLGASCAVLALCASLTSIAAPTPVAALADTDINDAAAFIAANQQPDGSFEMAGFAGFETPDAVLALAIDGQADGSWSAAEALAAVEAIDTNGDGTGLTALDYLDDLAEGTVMGPIGPDMAAKLILLVASPLGLDYVIFDPSGDGGAVDLRAVLTGGLAPDGSFGFFNETLFAAITYPEIGLPVPASTTAYIRAAQQANGSWNFAGDPAGTDADPDTTALALLALVPAAGTFDPDPFVPALRFLSERYAISANGSIAGGFDAGNPNSTALTALALVSFGYDPAESCWRTANDPAAPASPYVDPRTWIRSTQAADGHFASPSDGFGLNTFGTSQGVQALGNWLPRVVIVASEPMCGRGGTTTSSTSSTVPTSTSTTAAAGATTSSTVAVGGVTASTLPATGGPAGRTAAAGSLLLAVGGLLVLGARRLRFAATS